MIDGLAHLHSQNILHRDLKPRNIFLTTNASKEMVFKIGDFGVSKTGMFAETALGTPYYLAPEIVQGRPYSSPADVWSLGCVMYEAACGRPPFPGKSLKELLFSIVKRDLGGMDGVDVVVSKWVQECLRKDPVSRPAASQLKKTLDMKKSKPAKMLCREDCLKALLERFSVDEAHQIINCLSISDKFSSIFEKKTNLKHSVIIPTMFKHRQELMAVIQDEELIEKALALIRSKCSEREMEAMMSTSMHSKLLESNGYMLLKELADLEDQMIGALNKK